uniref:Uncharacterized protein n=1 Tax=viral metagenome TaxID=1070528 RepID=A0A6C0K8R8_9ZZZZ
MELKFVGEYFSRRFKRKGIVDQGALLARARRSTKAELEELLTWVFTNKRKDKCIDLAGRGYSVRKTNIKGYNSALGYLRNHRASKGVRSIGRRPVAEVFPKRCEKKGLKKSK